MKRKRLLWALLAVLAVCLFVACACDNNPEPEPNPDDGKHEVSVVALNPRVTLDDVEISTFDYTTLFAIVKDGQSKTVDKSYLDLSAVSAFLPTFNVTCTYEKQTATVAVSVNNTVTISQTIQELTIRASAVETYDFLALFSVKQNGASVEITPQMVQGEVKPVDGDYTLTVTYGSAKAVLVVHVQTHSRPEVVCSYTQISLTPSQISTYDYTMLFSLFVDGEAVEVTPEMVDATAVKGAAVGETHNVHFAYANGSVTATADVPVTVVAEPETKVSVKNIVTYPNGEYIAPTSLFEITKGNQTIPVTNDMVSGKVDYSKTGDNEITLTYDGQTYVATVTVKRGVVIDYATSDVITVQLGTDAETYMFADDFVVIVNGLRFRNIARFVDTSSVDFSTAGTYVATLDVPFNDGGVGLSGVNFKHEIKQITYNVVDVDYTVDVKQETVVLPVGTAEFDPYSNLRLVRNGKTNLIGEMMDAAGGYYCYAQCQTSVDFSSFAPQTVTVDLYVYYFGSGELGDKISVSYVVQMQNDVRVTATNRTTFGGESIKATELFTIEHNRQNVPVTWDMITGKVDTFHAGVYVVTLNYMGVTAQASVIVVNPQLVGTYKTGLTALTKVEDDDEEYVEDYLYDEMGGGQSEEPTEIPRGKVLGDLIIRQDGSITLNGASAGIVSAIDQNTLIVRVGSNNYTLYYLDGIVVLDPDNSIHLGFSDYKRPYVYFQDSIWELGDYNLRVNYGSTYVLDGTATVYSYDIFRLTHKQTQQVKWFGLRVHLINKTSSDTVYDVSWGEVTLSDSFAPVVGTSATLTMDGITVEFSMKDRNTGVVNKQTGSSDWDGKTFRGMVDGVSATLTVANRGQNITYSKNGVRVIGASSYELTNMMKNGGCDFDNNTVLLYNNNERDGAICAYKFAVNPANNTFTLLQKDGVFGKYATADGKMWVFLDGYGKGIINFNSSSYYTTQFTYTLQNQQVEATFFNVNSLFAHGRGITFNLADLKNVLTVNYSHNNEFAGVVFTNVQITDGAIVTFGATEFESGTTALDAIYESIKIVTKDGELTTAQKKSIVSGNKKYVDLSSVAQGVSGIYQITVNVLVDGVVASTAYAVQILTPIYSGSALVGTFGNGIVNSQNTLSVSASGKVLFKTGGTLYSGYAVMGSDGTTFTARAFNGDKAVTLSATSVANGLISVSASGAVALTELYTTGSVQYAGNTGALVRKITLDGSVVYTYSSSAVSAGEFVEVAAVEGEQNVYQITFDNGSAAVVRAIWGNDPTKGLVAADKLRGTYTKQGGENLTLDGFGSAKLGEKSGTYVASGNAVAVTSSGSVSVYDLNLAEHTYALRQIDVAALILDKVYQASYVCGASDSYSDAYRVTTALAFGENGEVTVYSSAVDYPNGTYNPLFAGLNGKKGTYFVQGSKIYVEIDSKSFALEVKNVLEYSIITVISTNIYSTEDGYFPIGTQFVLQG